ncbi:DEAD/DEAH box helicase family protein [Candidatus Nomurabacteria bacterium]|nr:DEAD/DEAH box helicase family protein [Candidatus Nomurabacteria bacterium]
MEILKQSLLNAGVIEKIKNYIRSQTANTETAILKGLQLRMLEAILNFLVPGNKEGYIVAPTGFGKTVLITQLLKAIDEPAYILVPRKALLHQTASEFGRFAEDLDVGFIYGLLKEFNKNVTIITYESFVRQTAKGKLNKNIKYLILDEPHTCLTDKRMEAVRQYEQAIKLGFTASPYYSDEKKVSNLLPTEILSVTVPEAVEEGFLCPFMVIIAETDTDISKVKVIGGDYSSKDLSEVVNIDSRNRAALKLYQTVPAFWNHSTFIHCASITHANSVAKLFQDIGISASAVHSDLEDTEIDNILYDFKAGKIKIICNVDMVTTGFDAPLASVCFNLRPTKSVVVATQRVRNLRIDPLNHKKFAYVVDFFDQTGRGKGQPICYADIIKQTFVVPERLKHLFPKEKMEKMLVPKLKINNLKVHTSYKKVLKVIAKRKTLAQQLYIPYEKWVLQVRKSGITSGNEYTKIYKNFSGWPCVPGLIYTLFPGWSKFFSRPERINKAKDLPYAKWKEEVMKLGITGIEEYKEHLKNNPHWPNWPYQAYKQFPGWRALYGGMKGFIPLQKWIEQVCFCGILNFAQYKEEYKSHMGWPSNPNKTYGLPFFEIVPGEA